MSNLSKDIQSGSDTRPPILDKTDFVSWQQRIRLYCQGKENGVNILKSIDEGSFRMGTLRETLIEELKNIKMTMSRMQLNSKFINNMLLEYGRFVTVVKPNRGLRDSNYDQLYTYLKQHEGRQNKGQGNNARGAGAASYRGAENRVRYANPADECDAFDFGVDEAPTAQTMFMANLSSADLVYDEAGPSYDSDILFEPAQHVSATTEKNVVDKSLTAELATYKEQVELHNKSMEEEITSLKKDFKQKENKCLEQFLDMKALKEKIVDKLFKQDQFLQTVHMLCKPKAYYDEQRKVAIGYKNPLCLTRAKQVQPALYNGHEIVKN
nr:retrovirus-related Pol polyprotein from transposon TNT 1-94 [Tanacetum cinerariifolium]